MPHLAIILGIRPDAAMFLGDTNSVIPSIAAAQLNIPIIHFEGLMRSYDWRMPEEKYRGISDHLSDIIYTYYPEYKKQGIDEGINPKAIVLVTNPIVDILQKYYFDKKDFCEKLASEDFFKSRKLEIDSSDIILKDMFTLHFGNLLSLKGKIKIIDKYLMSWGIDGARKSYSLTGKVLSYSGYYFSQLKLITNNFNFIKWPLPIIILTLWSINGWIKRRIFPNKFNIDFNKLN